MTQALSGSVAGRLAGRHLLLTGVTGFVGEALLHLLLHEVPDVRVSLLVRPKGSTGGAARIAKLLEKPVFAQAVADAGGVVRWFDRSDNHRIRPEPDAFLAVLDREGITGPASQLD